MIILALTVLFLLARGMGIFDKVFYFPEDNQTRLDHVDNEEGEEDKIECVDASEEHRTTTRTICRELETIQVVPVAENYDQVTYITL